MSQLVREHRNAKSARSVFDGALDVGFMHSVADNHSSAWISAGLVGGKEPRPAPTQPVFGILGGEAMGQHQGSAVLPIGLPHGSGTVHLLLHFIDQGRRQGDHPVVSSFGTANAESAFAEVDVLDT
jgi:hypothetical protein